MSGLASIIPGVRLLTRVSPGPSAFLALWSCTTTGTTTLRRVITMQAIDGLHASGRCQIRHQASPPIRSPRTRLISPVPTEQTPGGVIRTWGVEPRGLATVGQVKAPCCELCS